MFIHFNANPQGKSVGDCTVRAISKALNRPWNSVYTSLCAKGYEMSDMPDSNAVWGEFLKDCGFNRYFIPNSCPSCFSVSDFADKYNQGTYIVGTGTHVICIIDGCIYDNYDSSDKFPVYYYVKEK